MATTWTTNGSLADVQRAVNGAARGDTVTVPPGAFNWAGGTAVLTRGVTLLGAGRDSTTINHTAQVIQISPDATAIANEETIRVTGITFDGQNTAGSGNLYLISIQGAGALAAKPFKNLAIGNCRLRNAGFQSTAIHVIGQVRGVIYNNIFDRCDEIFRPFGNGVIDEWLNTAYWPSPSPNLFGSADNLFFEGNTIQWSSAFSGYGPGYVESGQGSRYVLRYNTWNMANATGYAEIWDAHGFQNFYSTSNYTTGQMVAEYYGNTFTGSSYFRWLSFRGSHGLVHNNIATNGSGTGVALNIDQYPNACTSNVNTVFPSTVGKFTPEINNTYGWNNTLNGSTKPLTPGVTGLNCGITENNNFYNYNAAFDGSVGMGRGTTTPAMSATNGVGYWKCSTATPTVDPAVVQTGHFYKRVAGAWVDYYTPYTYPHPLASGAAPYSPTTDTTVVEWLKADTLALANNAPVATWTASKGINLTQASGAAQPTFKNAQNGLPVIHTDGISQYMQSANFSPAIVQPNQIFIVFKLYTTGDQYFFSETSAGQPYQALITSSGQWEAIAPSNQLFGAVNTNWNIMMVQFNGAQSQYRINNGALTTMSGTPGTNAKSDMALGAGVNVNGFPQGFSQMDVGEIIIRNGTGDIVPVFNYLQRWISASTPTPIGDVPNSPAWPISLATVSAPFVVAGGVAAQSIETTTPSNGGLATYFFNVPVAGNYSVIASVSGVDGSSNSFFVAMDGEPTSAKVWNIPIHAGLSVYPVTLNDDANPTQPHVWNLALGTHTLYIRGREANTQLGDLSIANPLTAPALLFIQLYP